LHLLAFFQNRIPWLASLPAAGEVRKDTEGCVPAPRTPRCPEPAKFSVLFASHNHKNKNSSCLLFVFLSVSLKMSKAEAFESSSCPADTEGRSHHPTMPTFGLGVE
jgi:hypothetical protein